MPGPYLSLQLHCHRWACFARRGLSRGSADGTTHASQRSVCGRPTRRCRHCHQSGTTNQTSECLSTTAGTRSCRRTPPSHTWASPPGGKRPFTTTEYFWQVSLHVACAYSSVAASWPPSRVCPGRKVTRTCIANTYVHHVQASRICWCNLKHWLLLPSCSRWTGQLMRRTVTVVAR